MDTIGERIKIALRERDMKQSELANLTGIHKSAISSYINGKYEPKQNAIFQMAKALNVNEAWLMGYDDVDMEKEAIPRTREGILEYFHKTPELKVLFSVAEDLEMDCSFLLTICLHYITNFMLTNNFNDSIIKP